ncbi:hypothetical protein BD414DRAFT_579506 [Trametes punicea]|nr:hypothetical protein BD414DRAFT_579506 [Trametes punicea]
MPESDNHPSIARPALARLGVDPSMGTSSTRTEVALQSHDEEAALSWEEVRREAASMLRERDSGLIRAWADQADGLVTFAALFSGVVTAFIVESYKTLQPDKQDTIIALLRQIAAQLNGKQPSDVSTKAIPFEPPFSAVLQNALLFASLICSLLAAGLGVFHKEWLRQYTLHLPTDPSQLLRVIQHRYEGREKWRMWFTIAAISIFLQLGVAFFVGAALLFVWPLHPILRIVLTVCTIIWAIFWVGTAICPSFSSSCPFRSPLARLIFSVLVTAPSLVGTILCGKARRADGSLLPTMETRERFEVDQPEKGANLERNAFVYLYTAYRGDGRLASIDQCICDLPPREARRCIEDILRARYPNLTMDQVVREGRFKDADIKRLASIWEKLSKEADEKDITYTMAGGHAATNIRRSSTIATSSTHLLA